MIGLAAVMLVLRLMIEGYTYLVSDIPGVKGTAKSHIVEATLGLLLALTAYIILNTVNPKLVNNTVSLSKATLEIEDYGGDSPLIPGTPGSGKGGTGYDFSKVTFPAGIQCPKTGGSSSIAAIAVSFKDRVVYSQGRAWKSEPPRGTTGNGKIHLDCSSYVNTVLKCAGIEPPAGAFTGDIFASAPLIKSIETSGSTSTITTSDGKKVVLKPGDLVGWKPGDGSKGSGHVLMYIGNNTLRDVRNYKGFNGAGEEKLSTWASSRINNGYKLRVLKVIP
jgi:cell wall-associated NlpC family hydrolase